MPATRALAEPDLSRFADPRDENLRVAPGHLLQPDGASAVASPDAARSPRGEEKALTIPRVERHTRTVKRVLFAALFALSSCAVAPEFIAWEGGGAVITGTGGTRESLGLVDVWNNGTPPRKYEIIGLMSVRGSAPRVNGPTAKEARARGGDALIKVSDETRTTGAITTPIMNAYTSTVTGAISSPIQVRTLKYQVIRYIR